MFYSQDIFGRTLYPFGFVAQDPRIAQAQALTSLPLISSFVPQLPQVAAHPWHLAAQQLDPRFAAQAVNPWSVDPRLSTLSLGVHPALVDPRLAYQQNAFAAQSLTSQIDPRLAYAQNAFAATSQIDPRLAACGLTNLNAWNTMIPQTLQYPYVRSQFMGGLVPQQMISSPIVPVGTGCL